MNTDQGRTCKPHSWRIPEVGDTVLVCLECFRTLKIGDIPPYMESSMLSGYERRNGSDAGKVFSDAYHAAVEHLFPRPKLEHKQPARLPSRPRQSSLAELAADHAKRQAPAPKHTFLSWEERYKRLKGL